MSASLCYVFPMLVEILGRDVYFIVPCYSIYKDMGLREEMFVLQRFKWFVIKNFMTVKIFYTSIFKPKT